MNPKVGAVLFTLGDGQGLVVRARVEGERIVVEHEGDKSKTFTQMVALLPPGECRFAVAA